MLDDDAIASVLAELGPRLRRARTERGVRLADLAVATGVSTSTLSRLETGQRKASLELLLLIARVHHMPLDELIGSPEVGDPRVRLRPRQRNGRTVIPLTGHPGGVLAWKVIVLPEVGTPLRRTHQGYEWLYVLSGHLRLIVADHDITLVPGEVAEFDTRLPHWFGTAGDEPVELLSLLGKHGERIHVRGAPEGRVKGQ